MQVNRDKVAAFLDEVGCPYAAGTTDATVWLHGYLAGVSWTRQTMADKTEHLEFRVRSMDAAEEVVEHKAAGNEP
jgi:hypothetical protein